MVFGHYIENLKQKPEKDRAAIAFFFSVVITGAIFIFWLLNFNLILKADEPTKAESVPISQSSIAKTWSQGLDRLKTGWGVAGDKLFNFKNQIISSSSTNTQ